MFAPEGQQLQEHVAESVLAVGTNMAVNAQNKIRISSERRMSAAEDLRSQSASSTRKLLRFAASSARIRSHARSAAGRLAGEGRVLAPQ